MVSHVSKSQFRAKAFKLFRQIEVDGEPVVITHKGKPTLEVRRYVERDPLEILRGTVLHYDDPFEPIGLEDWEALR